jgi:uncharacterized protein (DUF2336 family)
MLALARSRRPADRERLLARLAELAGREAELTPTGQRLIGEIFMGLVAEAERDIRARLAERLAPARWVPRDLVLMLAFDEAEVARPVIAASPVLTEPDLIRLVVEATLEHQIEVARRAGIGAPVARALVDRGEPEAMAALAANDAAGIAPQEMARLVEASRRLAALRGPLARHPRLSRDLAERLYGWVGEALKASIAARFAIDPARLEKSLGQAVAEAFDPAAAADAQAGAPERRLVEKLQAAGQLRPGYLLKALREGRLSLFRAGLAALGGYDPEAVGRSLAAERVDLLALACVGVGIDRSVFPTLLTLVRELSQGRPLGAPGDAVRVSQAFSMKPRAAAEAFRAAARRI